MNEREESERRFEPERAPSAKQAALYAQIKTAISLAIDVNEFDVVEALVDIAKKLNQKG